MDGPSLVALQRPRFGTLMPSGGAVHIIKGLRPPKAALRALDKTILSKPFAAIAIDGVKRSV
jgi:hypothetical protein